VAVPVSQYSVMLSRIRSRVRPPVEIPVEERACDLLVVCIVVEHPGRQPDGGIGQAEADRLRVLGHLDDVAPLEDGLEVFECRGFLLYGWAARVATASRLNNPCTAPAPKIVATTSFGKALRK
jgi:hypothetical protein